ncbi:MAG: nucleotidyltransferase family protein [Verrucomicrobia bacterium]|nr:nucleotidyltransferase family protein [Verrucomicrobiota bacterium]
MKREKVIEVLANALPDLKSRYPIHHIELFGSVARNDNSEHSDIDLLVEVDPEIGLGIVDLSEELEKLLGTSIDLITTRGINPRLKKRIEQELIHVA